MNVCERFLKYVSFSTTSDENSETVPSTACQRALGKYLAEELNSIGAAAHMDDKGYVYASLPATEGCTDDALGFIAHMDTSPSVSGENIKARRIKYSGGDIDLGKAVLRASEFPFVEKYVGEKLIVTDGTTLLGADDKAGIAEIVSALEYFVTHPEIPHREISVCFTPDEEIGRGADHFDFASFKAKKAYTVDGGELGEIEYENFNAAACTVHVHGVNIHPGSAKNKMKNAVLMANEFVNGLPAAETPAHTEEYEGFYHVCDIRGDETLCTLHIIIRDFDKKKFEDRKQFVKNLCSYLNSVWGEGCFECEISDSYYNMKEKIELHMDLIERAKVAMAAVGAETVILPIRGGTDGARLSWEGLPCPNLSTGGANFHSIYEFISVSSLEKMTWVIAELAKSNK